MTVKRVSDRFQICGSCRRAWPTWDGFILDPAVRLIGMQAVMSNPDLNLLVFEHQCGSSISVLTPRLRHILPESDGGEQRPVLMGTGECRGHCLRLADLEQCEAPCRNARDRQLIRLVQRMKEAVQASASPDVAGWVAPGYHSGGDRNNP